jgi:hypothetical protein
MISPIEEERRRYAEAGHILRGLLEAQTFFIDRFELVASDGTINAKAIGYIYGFADRALQIAKLDVGSTYGIWVLMFLLASFDDPNADRMFDYLKQPNEAASLMEGVHLGAADYNAWALSKGNKIALKWKDCF